MNVMRENMIFRLKQFSALADLLPSYYSYNNVGKETKV